MKPHTISAIAISKTFMNDALDQIVLAGDPSHGIFRSTDRGATWAQSNLTNEVINAVAFAITPNTENSGTAFAGGNSGVFKSTDGGKTWAKTGFDTAVTSLAVSPNYLSDHVLFAGTSTGVFESTDGGEHWGQLGATLASVNAIALTPDFKVSDSGSNSSASGTIFAGTESGVFYYIFGQSGSTTSTLPTSTTSSTTNPPTTSTTTSGGGGTTGSTNTTVISTTSTTVAGTKTIALIDVRDSDWFAACVKTMIVNGMINGYPNQAFRPNNSITRAEFAKMIILAIGEKPSSTHSAFPDVADNWAKGYIQRASELGIITGYTSGRFGPNQPISRQEIAVMIVKAGKFGTEDTFVPEFPDVTVDLWSWKAIEKAVDLGIIKGYTDGTFKPFASATRAEAAAMVCRMLQQLQ